MSATTKKEPVELVVPAGVQLRRGKNTESIGMSFYFDGQEYRETVTIPINQKNINYVANRRTEILHKIAYGKFVYEECFPNSLKSRTAAKDRQEAEAKVVVVAAMIVSGSVKGAGCWMQPTRSTVAVRFGGLSKDYKMSSFKQLTPFATSQKFEVL